MIQDKGKKNLKTDKNFKNNNTGLVHDNTNPHEPPAPFSLLFVHFLFLSTSGSFLNLLWTFSLSIKKKGGGGWKNVKKTKKTKLWPSARIGRISVNS